jgi:hypothetical protein
MKVYFGFTVAGDRSSFGVARKIVLLMEKLGHEVLTRHLVDENAWEADRLITPHQVYRRDMAWLDQCHVLTPKFPDPLSAWGSRPATCWVRRTRRSYFCIAGILNRSCLF